jgi:hypothetical protein
MLRLALQFSAILIAFDAVAALVAKAVSVSYDSFVVLTVVLVFFMGIYAGRRRGLRGGILAIAIVACVEATIGWYVAALIGPGYVPGWTMRLLIVMAAETALLEAVLGTIGVWIGQRSTWRH